MNRKKITGDFQTPQNFTDKVCRLLYDKLGLRPKTILEPTCGEGNFLMSSRVFRAEKYYGVEINPAYCQIARENMSGTDTAYFIPFTSYDDAYVAILYLNSDAVRDFLKARTFPDAKRPYTKKILQNLDFSKIESAVPLSEVKMTELNLGLTPYVTSDMVKSFAEKTCS
ncbi:MAG: SAM-dependent methyltransferase [Clostridia bacterium]|nr:SAM-dependent methyltransferase [Clostridia bacterium]